MTKTTPSDTPSAKTHSGGATWAKVASTVGWMVWTAVAFLLAMVAVTIILSLLKQTGVIEDARNLDVMGNTLVAAVVYSSAVALAVSGPRLVKRIKLAKFRQLVGLDRRPEGDDLSRAVIGFLIYFGVWMVVAFAATIILGNELMGQEQTLDYATTGNSFGQLAVIFLALVVIAPIAEEMLMRGFLFGRLRRHIPFWPTAILVSLLFAIAHGQVNVALDTFVLSMVMCYMREKSGAIYSTIGIHMLKNGLAFYVLFILQLV
jgi:membrane protease YdiL (CAAX protease family)